MTSASYRRTGLIQFVLALGFVIWLVVLPGSSASFAWPIGSRLSSMFLGACFALRCFEGFWMWREPDWSRLRWMSWGTMAFLVVIFAATYWHIDLMNWKPFHVVAAIWLFAYTGEPLLIPFVEPRDTVPGSRAEAAGDISSGLHVLLLVVMLVSAALFGVLFINPVKFATNIWPWPLTPFDARVGSAFFAGIVLWAARMNSLANWRSIRMGVQGLLLFFGGHFLVWLFNLATGAFDPARMLSAWVYGIVVLALAAALLFFYLRHERGK
jgi:uncharacterized membrane protein